MPAPRLSGSRIRDRRLAAGKRQSELAREVGISPAYLSLIESNRRRIGGKLIVDIARALGLEPAALAEGAEDALAQDLRDAAARLRPAAGEPELARAEEFAGRFPGWAGLVGTQARRVEELERLAEALSDRLAHDPHLAASLHEVLSAVTAIRSAAAILAEPDLGADWRDRFVRNVREESRRLSESAEGLVAWLDAGGEVAAQPMTAADELAVAVAEAGYHFAALEAPGAGEAELRAELDRAGLSAAGAVELGHALLDRYRREARAMPAAAFLSSKAAAGGDPGRLATAFGTTSDAVLRRLASLDPRAGLVSCDGTGTLMLKKPVEGFALPRFGAGCPLWPLYQALARPAQPVSALVDMPGRLPRRYLCRAVSVPRPGAGFDAPPVYEATMLIEPAGDATAPALAAGSTCRVCPREACAARREPTILAPALAPANVP